MGQVHQCGYLTSAILFEIERVKEGAKNQNKETVSSHLALVDKELDNMAIFCELGDYSGAKGNIENIKRMLGSDNYNGIHAEALAFEKDIITKQAQNFNDGNDPLDVIPSRLWDALK